MYSIGHGNKEIGSFIDELKCFGVEYLLDIRSKPFSRWNPQFNRPGLESELRNHGIIYVFAGDTLGGLPDDKSCYDENGRVVYDRMKEKDFFKQGIKRLLTANSKKINLAIMCSESKPEECHRSKLIGRELMKMNISLDHIVSEKRIKSQTAVIGELTKGQGTVGLFGTRDLVSRKAY